MIFLIFLWAFMIALCVVLAGISKELKTTADKVWIAVYALIMMAVVTTAHLNAL